MVCKKISKKYLSLVFLIFVTTSNNTVARGFIESEIEKTVSPFLHGFDERIYRVKVKSLQAFLNFTESDGLVIQDNGTHTVTLIGKMAEINGVLQQIGYEYDAESQASQPVYVSPLVDQNLLNMALEVMLDKAEQSIVAKGYKRAVVKKGATLNINQFMMEQIQINAAKAVEKVYDQPDLAIVLAVAKSAVETIVEYAGKFGYKIEKSALKIPLILGVNYFLQNIKREVVNDFAKRDFIKIEIYNGVAKNAPWLDLHNYEVAILDEGEQYRPNPFDKKYYVMKGKKNTIRNIKIIDREMIRAGVVGACHKFVTGKIEAFEVELDQLLHQFRMFKIFQTIAENLVFHEYVSRVFFNATQRVLGGSKQYHNFVTKLIGLNKSFGDFTEEILEVNDDLDRMLKKPNKKDHRKVEENTESIRETLQTPPIAACFLELLLQDMMNYMLLVHERVARTSVFLSKGLFEIKNDYVPPEPVFPAVSESSLIVVY
jgi:hypothetical protein